MRDMRDVILVAIAGLGALLFNLVSHSSYITDPSGKLTIRHH